MPQFRKKPVVVEARRFETNNDDGTCLAELRAWVNAGHDEEEDDGKFTHFAWHDNTVFYIDTMEGTMEANVGDWIIKGVKGEFYPCKPDVFELTYEEVADAVAVEE